MSFVRERRLERVHEELADALPSDGVTVTQVAERWGSTTWAASPSSTASVGARRRQKPCGADLLARKRRCGPR